MVTDIQKIEHNGITVLTTQQIADAYETNTDTITKNFNRNKERYTEGKHYICLKGDELKEFRANGQIDLSPNTHTFYLWTKKGAFLHAKSLNTDNAWELYDALVDNYFDKREPQIDTSELSESLQAFQQIFISMAKQELETKRLTIEVKRANDTAEKAFKVTESIKEAVKPVTDNWREKINAKFNRIQKNTDTPFSYLRNEMYQLLEQRAGCDLGTRLRNKRQRMADSGCTKTQVDKTNKMDIIEEDKRLRQIFTTIVTEYEIKYCACEVEM